MSRMFAPSFIAAVALGALVAAACGNTPPHDRAATMRTAAGAVARSETPRHVSVQGIDLTGVGYDRGSQTAPVVVVDFSDFGCPFCGSFARESYPAIDRDYVQTGKVFFKYVPFVMGMFPNGDEAARAAECAGDQGGFWPMYERLYAGQGDWKRARAPMPIFERYAVASHLDAPRFTRCSGNPALHPRTKVANTAADRLGIRATPTFFVDGRMIEGALPLPQFRELLDAAGGGGSPGR